MKKSIALLLTLFVVFAISLIILKILNNNEKLIKYCNFDTTLTQFNILIKDINNEVLKYMKQAESLDDNLPQTIPINIKNINIVLSLELIDLQEHIVLDGKLKNIEQNEQILNNIDFLYDFKQIFKTKVSNFRQINYLINQYIKLTQDKNILKIKHLFIYPHLKQAKYKLSYNIAYNNTKAYITVFISKAFNIVDNTIMYNL